MILTRRGTTQIFKVQIGGWKILQPKIQARFASVSQAGNLSTIACTPVAM
jgi:hypothetical protein